MWALFVVSAAPAAAAPAAPQTAPQTQPEPPTTVSPLIVSPLARLPPPDAHVDMPGGDDPEMRAPMRWDLVKPDNPVLNWNRRLVSLHKDNRALRVGNYRAITAGQLIGFERYTDRAADTIVVSATTEPTDRSIPPARITKVMPTATTSRKALSISRLRNTWPLKKPV